MVDFDALRDKAEDFAREHDEQVDSGIDKAADFLGDKVGHDEQIRQGAEKLKGLLPDDDTPAT
ncbi:MAG TPA: antitoxin [Jatrophihabitans sp.]|nr:antitoxin [Jatrophihabitans sp.]